MKHWIWICLVILLGLAMPSPSAQAGALTDRLSTFPHWDHPPLTQPAKGDLFYPDWMIGTWSVTSTLVDLVAPLAPEIVSPGFESNRRTLNQPVTFLVRFVSAAQPQPSRNKLLIPGEPLQNAHTVIADRAFNGLNLARAYLGDRQVLSVKVDPRSPNRQITQLRNDRQLVSIITERNTETPDPDTFMTTEIFQQFFRGMPQAFFNVVENTTAYSRQPASSSSAIVADQITAVYLSPQDPDYFQARDRPVALYRYRLDFHAMIPEQPTLP